MTATWLLGLAAVGAVTVLVVALYALNLLLFTAALLCQRFLNGVANLAWRGYEPDGTEHPPEWRRRIAQAAVWVERRVWYYRVNLLEKGKEATLT